MVAAHRLAADKLFAEKSDISIYSRYGFRAVLASARLDA
jgi:hypothetical protein